jgi:c-di-GMP-binding flagellar brake protein YcgR
MAIEKYKIGQKISLTRKNDNNGDSYYSTIQNITDNEIYIDIPYLGKNPLVLMHYEKIDVKYITKSAAFAFTASCLGVHKETETLQFYKLSAPTDNEIKKIQMREFVRVPMMLDVEYYLPDSEEKHKGTTVDLSGGGMKLATKNKLAEKQVIDLYFKIYKKRLVIDMEIKAQVVRSELVDQQLNTYHSGLKFLNLTRTMEDTIVSFVFEKQMQQLRRR